MKYKFTSINLSNATVNVDTETIYESDTPQLVQVLADSKYYFDTAPSIVTKSYIGTQDRTYMNTDETGEYKSSYYLLIDTAFLESKYVEENSFSGYATISLTATGVMIPAVDKYGIIQLYNPTPLEMKEIGDVRFYSGDQAVDLGNFISNLLKVFVKIPEGDRTEVMLGGYGTGVTCNVIGNDIVETDCGTVEIVGKYGNSMDYENTTVEIYLPFIGFKELETEKVMNETLSLVYRTNVINGDTIALIYNTTGTLIYTFNCKASFEIPYTMNSYDTKGDVAVNADYLFGFTPTVTIRYNKAYNASATVGNDNQDTTLGNLTGFVKCSEVFNTINATTAEKDEIDELLRSGVIIS